MIDAEKGMVWGSLRNRESGKKYIKLCEHIEKIYQNEIKHGNTPVLISTPKYVDRSATAEIYVIMENKLQSYDIDGIEEMFYTDYHFPSERFYCCKSCMHCISGPVDEDQKIWFKPSPDDLPFENVEARNDNVYVEEGTYGKYMRPTVKIDREK